MRKHAATGIMVSVPALIILLLTGASVRAQDGWGRLQNFEDGDLSRWSLDGPGQMHLDSTYATQVKRNLRVSFGSAESELTVSLRGIWRMEEIIREKFSDEGGGGWKIYEAFFTDVYSPGPVGLLVTFRDSLGGAWSELRTLDKGLNMLQWKSEALEGVSWNALAEVSFSPAGPATLYFDHLRTWEHQPELDERGRMDITHSDRVESPHIAWQRPDAGGAVNGLFTPSGGGGRAMAELMQRFELHPATVTLEPSLGLHRWAFGDFYGTRALAYDHVTTKFSLSYTSLTSELESDKPFEVIVLTPMRGWHNMPAELRKALLERVRGGTGLVLMQPTGYASADDLWELSPLKGDIRYEEVQLREADQPEQRPGGIKHSKWKVADRQHYITRGIPLELIPTEDIDHLAYRADGADVLIESAEGLPVLAAGTYGRGRVAAVAWSDQGMFPRVQEPLERKNGLPYWEYLYALVGRTVRWAAGRDGAEGFASVRGPAGSPPIVRASLRCRPGDSVRCVVRNQDFEVLLEKEIPAKEGGLELPLEGLSPGELLIADLWLIREGRVVDFATSAGRMEPAGRITALSTGSDTYTLGQAISGTVGMEGSGRVALSLEDNRGRLLAVDTLSVDSGGSAGFSFPTDGCLARRAVLTARVLAENGQNVHSRKLDLFIDRPASWDDYEVMMYRFMGQILPGEWNFLDSYMEQLGVTAWAAVGPEFVFRSNLGIQAETRLDTEESLDGAGEIPYREAKENYLETRDKKYLHRLHCLHDPGYLDEQKAVLEDKIGRFKRFSPLSYYCYEEPSLTHYGDAFDLCFSPHTLSAFREWLREQYGNLEALNRQWGTDFSGWADVIPDDTFEARERGNYSSWADHRAFMDISYAGNYSYVRDVVRSIDRDGLVMMTGTQRTVPHNGYDYYLLDRAIDHTQPYGQPARHLAFMREGGKITGCTGYGVFGPKLAYELWNRLFFGHTAGSAIFWQFSTIDPDYTLSKSGRDMMAIFHDLRHRGMARLVDTARRTPSQVVVHYSMPSVRGTWIQDGRIIESDGAPSAMFDRWEFNYESWRWLLEDLGVPYRVSSAQMIENGWLRESGAKILVLPNTIALSEEEADEIREFIARGGVVIGDAQTGWMDGHCRWRGKQGALDRAFGVRGASLEPVPVGSHTTVRGGAPGLEEADPGIRADGARPLDLGPGLPPVLYREAEGGGGACMLNCFLSGYGRLRQEGHGASVRAAAGGLLSHAGYEPLITMRPASGADLRGTRMFTYDLGEGGHLVGLLKDYRIREPARDIILDMPGEGYFYDALEGSYIGRGDELHTSIGTGEVKLLASLPYMVADVELELPARAARGGEVEFGFGIRTANSRQAGPHVFVVEVFGPEGEKLGPYGGNVAADRGRAASSFRPALNDPAGRWRVRVRDAASGVSRESFIDIH